MNIINNHTFARPYLATCTSSSQSSGDEIELLHNPGEHQEREPSILDKLRPPLRSQRSRKRKIEKPVTTNKKHKAGVANTTDPKTVTPATRVKQFPGEYLSGKLFVLPSSASVERVFSQLKQFTEQQQSALEDYVEAALMIQYNH